MSRVVYPSTLKKGENGYIIVDIPDFNISTQGKTYGEAIEMARDAIGMKIISMEDKGKPIPKPKDSESFIWEPDLLIQLIDIDITEFRRKVNLESVRTSVTLPGWLSYEADRMNINKSGVLQEGLINKLGLQDRSIYIEELKEKFSD